MALTHVIFLSENPPFCNNKNGTEIYSDIHEFIHLGIQHCSFHCVGTGNAQSSTLIPIKINVLSRTAEVLSAVKKFMQTVFAALPLEKLSN